MTQKLTPEQGIIITGFTGIMCCPFSDFHKDVEARLGRPVFTHELGFPETWEEVKAAYREDFMGMLASTDNKGVG